MSAKSLLIITNRGHLTSTGTYTITDEVPADTHYVTGSASPAAETDGPNFVRWVSNSAVGIGQPITVSYVVTITDPLTDETRIVNLNYDVEGGNAFFPASGNPVTITVATPVTLTVGKSDDPDPVQAGELLTYTLVVTNDPSSKGPASNVFITDTIPASTTLVNAGFISPTQGTTSTLGSTVIWNVTDPNPLQINQTATAFMIVRVDAPLPNNTILLNDNYGAGASNDQVTVPTPRWSPRLPRAPLFLIYRKKDCRQLFRPGRI